MKQMLTLAALVGLLAGCASQGGTGAGSETTYYRTTSDGLAPSPGTDTPLLPFQSPGNDRNDTGTSSGRGVSDLGAASPGDQQQREPYDPRLHWR
jgi:hypothetical protein